MPDTHADDSREAERETPLESTSFSGDQEQVQNEYPPDVQEEQFKDELQQAHAHFRAINVGATRQHVTPLSRQIQLDIEKQFPVDTKFFRLSKNAQRKTVMGYGLMRLITLILFTVMSAIQFSIYVEFNAQNLELTSILPDAVRASPFGSGVLSAVLYAAVFGLVFWGMRLLVRAATFHLLKQVSANLSFEIFRRLDTISSRVTETAAKTRDRVGVRERKGAAEWPARARDWTIIALWNAKRAEYLDRFITVVIWTVRTRIAQMEVAMLVVKTLVVLAFAAIAAASISDFSAIDSLIWMAVTLAMLAQTVLLWHRAGMRPNDFWTNRFRQSAQTDPGLEETYVDKIGGIVHNLVDEVIAKEWGQGTNSS